MSGHRKALRDAVRVALAADPRIGAYTHVVAWSRAVEEDRLPAYAVYVPRDPSGAASQDTVERRTVIEVLLKRKAETDIEDDIDIDVDAIEARVLPALLSVPGVIEADLNGPEFAHSGEGAALVYEARNAFSVTLHTEIPTAG